LVHVTFASLPIISKKERFESRLILCPYCLEITADHVEKSLKEKLSLNKLICTRFKGKLNDYASCFSN
jgi:hypothetical protein